MKTIKELILQSSGLIKILSERALEVGLPYPEWALASALSILAGVSQRTYRVPMGASPNLYNIIVGPPGSGKNTYLTFVKEHLAAAHDNFVMGELVSRTGTLAGLAKWPSRTLVSDELGQDWLEMHSVRADQVKRQLRATLLEFYSDNKRMSGTANKKTEDQVKSVKHPRLSIFGATTIKAMNALYENDLFISSGMVSRATFWVAEKAIIPLEPGKSWDLVLDHVDALRRISRPGFHGLEAEAYGEKCVDEPKEVLEMGKEAGEAMLAFYREVAELRRSLNSDDEALEQVYSRTSERAYKYAYLHCIGRESRLVSKEDAGFGIALAKWEMAAVKKRVDDWMLPEDRIANKIEAYMKKNRGVELVKASIRHHVSEMKKIDSRVSDDILHDMVANGRIDVVKRGRAIFYFKAKV